MGWRLLYQLRCEDWNKRATMLQPELEETPCTRRCLDPGQAQIWSFCTSCTSNSTYLLSLPTFNQAHALLHTCMNHPLDDSAKSLHQLECWLASQDCRKQAQEERFVHLVECDQRWKPVLAFWKVTSAESVCKVLYVQMKKQARLQLHSVHYLHSYYLPLYQVDDSF